MEDDYQHNEDYNENGSAHVLIPDNHDLDDHHHHSHHAYDASDYMHHTTHEYEPSFSGEPSNQEYADYYANEARKAADRGDFKKATDLMKDSTYYANKK